MVFAFNHLWWRIICCRVSSQFTIQNMVYSPGLTGLTGWLKKQTITRFIPSFCSTLILTDKLQTPKTSNFISARKFYSQSLDFPTNSNFGSWQSKLNKRYHFRPIIGLPICSTIMKAPFIIFGQFGTQVSHSLSNILSSSTICVDSSNCLLRWAGWCVLLRVSKTALFLYQILGFQITFLRHDSFDRLPFVATTPEPLLLKSLLLHIFHQRT